MRLIAGSILVLSAVILIATRAILKTFDKAIYVNTVSIYNSGWYQGLIIVILIFSVVLLLKGLRENKRDDTKKE